MERMVERLTKDKYLLSFLADKKDIALRKREELMALYSKENFELKDKVKYLNSFIERLKGEL